MTNLAELTLSTQSSILGKEYESALVTVFIFQKFVQKCGVKSHLGTSKQGELHALELGTASPFSNK